MNKIPSIPGDQEEAPKIVTEILNKTRITLKWKT